MKHIAVLGFLTLFYQKTYAIHNDCRDSSGECVCHLGWWGRNCEYPLECLIPGDNGIHYRGTQNVTSDGTVCDPWDLTNPPGGRFETPPDGPHHNYCRHVPSDSELNTWCYVTSHSHKRSSLCNISVCDTQCAPPKINQHIKLLSPPQISFEVNSQITFGCDTGYTIECKPLECLIPGDNGEHYRGTQNVTSDGTTCDLWDSENPPGGSFVIPPDGPHHNYCRHIPSYSFRGTWCYTTTGASYKRRRACTIPMCDPAKLSSNSWCQKGYYKSDSITCTSTKTWSQEPPSCIGVCMEPALHNHSKIVGTKRRPGYLFMDRIEVKCDIGYYTTEETNFVCKNNGRWNGSMPTCSVIKCNLPTAKKYSRILNASKALTYGERIVIKCAEGYVIARTGILTCQENQLWDHATPGCLAVCNAPQLNGHSEITQKTRKSKYTYLEVINVTCDDGYKTTNLTEFFCQEDTKWNGSMPVCLSAVCNVPQLNDHSHITEETRKVNYTYLDIIHVACDDGYKTTNQTQFFCQEDAKWNGSMPVCSAVCNVPQLKDHSNIAEETRKSKCTYLDIIHVTCDDGYKTINRTQFFCQEDRKWNGVMPVCSAVCYVPQLKGHTYITEETRKGSYTYLDIIHVTCDDGYKTTNQTQFFCQEDAKWNGSMPVCSAVCNVPQLKDHSNITEETRKSKCTYLDIIHVTCDDGYKTINRTQFFCQEDRKWNGVMPVCSAVCYVPQLKGHTYITEETRKGSYTYLDIIHVTCDDGYKTTNQTQFFCQEGAKWNGSMPVCSAVCNVPQLKDHSNITEETRKSKCTYLDIIHVTCDDGYKTINRTQFFCQEDRKWNGVMPVCSAVCNVPQLKDHTYITEETRKGSYTYLDIIHVTCDDGYKTTHQTQFFCQEDRKWNGSMPVCSAVCDAPQLDGHSQITEETRKSKYTYLDKIHVTCDDGYMTANDTQFLCQEDRKWNSSMPVCSPFCMPPILESNSKLLEKRMTYAVDDAIQIECVDGFEVEGKTRFICQNDRTWNGTMPKCKANNVRYDARETIIAVLIGTTSGLAVCLIAVTVALILTCSRYRKREKNKPICASMNEVRLSNIHLHESQSHYDVINHELKETESIYDEIPSS